MKWRAWWFGLVLAAVAGIPGAATGQAADTASFTVLRRGDTIAVERYVRAEGLVTGRLVIPAAGGARTEYRAVVTDDGQVPMIEVSAWQAADTGRRDAPSKARLIFRDDSVSIDQIRTTGLETRILPTTVGALPYLNLSVALLELATGRARRASGDSVPVPFFNLGGGQTLAGEVLTVGADSALIRIGKVEFHLAVDRTGRILGGSVPSQEVDIVRGTGG